MVANYFISTKEMPLFNYIKFLDSGDLVWFSDYYSQKIKIFKPKEKLLNESMMKIYGQILEFTEDFEIIEKFQMSHKLMKMQTRYNAVLILLKTFSMYDKNIDRKIFDELFEQFSKWGYKINFNNDIFLEIEKIQKRLKALYSEIESLTIKLKEKNKSEKVEIEEIILNTELTLELKYKIDTKTTTLHEWLIYQKKAKKRIEQLNKVHNGAN